VKPNTRWRAIRRSSTIGTAAGTRPGLSMEQLPPGLIPGGSYVRRVVFLDHLDTRAAVLSDLVDVGAFHQAEADVCIPQTVGCTGSSFAVKAKILFVEDGFEKLALPPRKNKVRRSGNAPLIPKFSRGYGRFCGRVHAINARRAKPASKSLKRPHSTGHTLAVSDAALSGADCAADLLPGNVPSEQRGFVAHGGGVAD
jgi:hypothetical protein